MNSFQNPSQSFRALNFSLNENLGHCKKNNMNNFYKKLSKNEMVFLRKKWVKNRKLFFFSLVAGVIHSNKC